MSPLLTILSTLFLSFIISNGLMEGEPRAPSSYFTEAPQLQHVHPKENNISLASNTSETSVTSVTPDKQTQGPVTPVHVIEPSNDLDGDSCKWTTTNGYKLDLSSLYGSILTYSSTSSTYAYYYTPCNDGVICTQNDTNLDTMAVQDNNGFCVAYLAKFDSSVTPVYSESSLTFTFEYNNGEVNDICDDPRELIIEWVCDPNEEYKMKSVTEVASCIYEITVDSYLACVNISGPTTTTTQIPYGCEFGMYDYSDSDAVEDEGWYLMTLDDFSDHKQIFVEYYNKNNGINCIKSFDCGNCCFAVDDDYLTVVNGMQDNYECDVFPAIAPDIEECCPSEGYNEGDTYIFYRNNYNQYLTHLTISNLTFGEVNRCSHNSNPAVYQRNCF